MADKKTKEEILKPYIETVLRHTKVVSEDNALKAMQEFADQEIFYTKPSGVQLIAKERQRQIDVEGWTPDHDAQHINGELANAAATYALTEEMIDFLDIAWGNDQWLHLWPFDLEWLKVDNDRIKSLAKAGALIAAEIDRLFLETKSDGSH